MPNPTSTQWVDERNAIINGTARSSYTPLVNPLVRVNIHYMLKSNGTGNFNETNDGMGNPLNGYQFADSLILAMNNRQYNLQMSIPPGNTVPILNKNYNYVLDAVYFVRNDTFYHFDYSTIPANYPRIGNNTDSVINIFLTDYTPQDSSVGGYTWTLDQNSKMKLTVCEDYYLRYKQYLANGPTIDCFCYVMDGLSCNTNHEIGHNLGLSHTVTRNNHQHCPTVSFGGGAPPYDPTCDDGCGDTPTAWDITDSLHSGVYPDNGWRYPSSWQSNNLMDYGGYPALTPCQLNSQPSKSPFTILIE